MTYVFHVLEVIREIPSEFISKDEFKPSFTIPPEHRDHPLTPCANCGKVKLAHFDEVAERAIDPEIVPKLTDRELDVLKGIAEGLPLDDIAKRHYMAQSTVKAHTAKLYHKLQAHNRVQAVNKARDFGLI